MNFCSNINQFDKFYVIDGVIDDKQIEVLMDYWYKTPIGVYTDKNNWNTTSTTKTKIDATNRVVEIIGIQKYHFEFLSNILTDCFECVIKEFSLEYPHYFTYYPMGGKHSKHRDFIRQFNREWVITLMLNDNFEGGDLVIDGQITPKKKGSVIIYDGSLFHEVTSVVSGERFVITECAGKN
jgi:predicted 2-oxoglutarate/Fe(II)-dependent dioxygenase YbiX